MITDSVNDFLDEFFADIQAVGIDVSSYYLDHVAYQASSNDDYDMVKAEILTYGTLESEEIIGDRRVGIFSLITPLTYKDRVIPVLELIAPKEGQVCLSAFEHGEFVVSESFEAIMNKYPHLSWDTTSALRKEFPHLKLRLSETMQVKFHPQDILEIIAVQKQADFANQVQPLLLRCRPGDYEHALRVVKWVEELAVDHPHKGRFIKAAYVHDLGWYNVVVSGEKLTKDELKRLEPKANEQSETIIADFLKHLGESKNEIDKILQLVKAADLHESGDPDEAIIVDADNLSKLTIDHVAEKYQKRDWLKMLTLWQDEFPKRIQTEKGKALYPKLLHQLETDIQSHV